MLEVGEAQQRPVWTSGLPWSVCRPLWPPHLTPSRRPSLRPHPPCCPPPPPPLPPPRRPPLPPPPFHRPSHSPPPQPSARAPLCAGRLVLPPPALRPSQEDESASRAGRQRAAPPPLPPPPPPPRAQSVRPYSACLPHHRHLSRRHRHRHRRRRRHGAPPHLLRLALRLPLLPRSLPPLRQRGPSDESAGAGQGSPPRIFQAPDH